MAKMSKTEYRSKMLPLGVPVVIEYPGATLAPNWLKNYSEHLRQQHGDLDIFDLLVKEWPNAEFRAVRKYGKGGNRCFIFPNEPAYTMFLLKWD